MNSSDNNSPFENKKTVLVPPSIRTSLSNLSLLSPELIENHPTAVSAPPTPIAVPPSPPNPPQPKRHSSLSGPSGAKAFLMAMGMTCPVGSQDQNQPLNNLPFSPPASQLSRTRSWNVVNSGKLNRQKSSSYAALSTGIPFAKSRTNSISESCHSSHSSQPLSPAASFLSTFTERSPPKLSPSDEEGEEVGGYVLGKVLGTGMFSIVRKAFTMRGQHDKINVVAVKIIKKEPDTADAENIPTLESTATTSAGRDAEVDESSNSQSLSDAHLEREIDIWRQLDHPHVLKLIEVVEQPQTTFIFCDYCPGGDMLTHLRRKGTPGLPEPEAARLWTQLASAVLYLHEILRVAHRDIKLENILLNETGDVKLGDFGFADYVHHSHRLAATPATMGSLAYCAPELVRPPKSATSAAPPTSIPMKLRAGDSWALGVILFAFVTGSLPFADDFEPRMIMKISNVRYAWSSTSTILPSEISSSGAANTSSSSETSPLASAFPSVPSYSIEPPSTPSSPTRHAQNTASPLAPNIQTSSSPISSFAALTFSPPSHSDSTSFPSAPSNTTFGPTSSELANRRSSRTNAKSMGSPLVRSLVAGLLNAKWRDRWTVRTALESPWIKGLKN